MDKKFIIVVSGARDWTDRKIVESVLNRFDAKTSVLIHGDCRGLDKMAGDIAEKLGFEVRKFPAQWDIYGKAAGPIRNIEMLKQNPDIIIVFHENLDKSRGTKSFVNSAIKMGLLSKMFMGNK